VTENEKLRALLAEARAWVGREPEYYKAHHEMDALLARIDAALAEPVGPERSPLAVGQGTWSVFAEKVVAERDEARAEVARLKEDREAAFFRGEDDGYRRGHKYGFQYGAEAMREAACDQLTQLRASYDLARQGASSLAVAGSIDLLRALPLPEDKR
jgi:flagellar biosynthesis/type III secretory pathway protein FliH